VESSLWKRLRTCRKTGYRMDEVRSWSFTTSLRSV
jgi:hypothetical protein